MKIAFLGDIALIGRYDLTNNSEVYSRLTKLADELSKYDYVIANLESPLTDITKSSVCKSMHLRSSAVNVEILKYLHIDAVSVANNHMFDFGSKGFRQTVEALEAGGIEWFGAGNKYILKDINGEKVSLSGFVCYTTNASGCSGAFRKYGVNPLAYEDIKNQLETDEKQGAFSIMSFHWGDEHTNYPKRDHIRFAESIASKKNVIIHGHHPHVIQGVQELNKSLIMYSLGNCIFDDCVSITGKYCLKQNPENKKSFIAAVEINNGAIESYRCIGFKDEPNGFEFFDISEELSAITDKLGYVNEAEYDAERIRQIRNTFEGKFGKRDFKWLKSRLNYYSIGARIISFQTRRKYIKEVQKFLNGG